MERHLMTLGPFSVDRNGLLQPASPEHFPSFSVRWRGRQLHARLIDRHGGGSDGELEFTSQLGRVPSSAAPPNRAGQRETTLSLLRTLPSLAPPNWVIRLSADHSVTFATTTTVPFPTSAVSLIGLVTEQLLALAPYLGVLDEAGLDGPMAADLGMVNT